MWIDVCCIIVCIDVCVCICVSICLCACTCMLVYKYVWIIMYICLCSCIRVCTVACYRVADSLVRFEPVTGDSDYARCGTDTLAIRKPIHGIIWRSVPIRVVKTRQRFGSKIASFHVGVCSYIIFLFIIASWCSCSYSYYFMWSFEIFYQYDYLYHFMRYQWYSLWLYSLSECLSASFHVLVVRHYWLRPSIDMS